MSIPRHEIPLPDIVAEQAGDRVVKAVWVNGIGGTTWQLGEGPERDFLKIGPAHPEFDVDAEVQRLAWLARWVCVPQPVAWGHEGPYAWLLTRGLNGDNSVSDANRHRPGVVVPALGRGLRRFHDLVPVQGCPFGWSAGERILGLKSKNCHEIPTPSPVHRVVCHGDACSPNFLIGDDAEVSGYVDCGRTGVGDRHADLAPALQSLEWNYGAGWSGHFLDSYCEDGLRLDAGLIDSYRELWNAE
ncbi:phosphotransferase [Luteococcus sp. OSA5]|uniref:phosphotransferase n=1 Tax=Luteococcus sp. OSA5 TaxID=3401630 RepID=UPI003B4379D2